MTGTCLKHVAVLYGGDCADKLARQKPIDPVIEMKVLDIRKIDKEKERQRQQLSRIKKTRQEKGRNAYHINILLDWKRYNPVTYTHEKAIQGQRIIKSAE